MATMRIMRTGSPELEFEGQLLVRTGPERGDEDTERWHHLCLYLTADRHFVPVYEYHTTCQTERRVIDAEMVNDVIDVESFYFAHEPNAHVNELVLNSLSRERRQRINKELFQDYDRQSAEVVRWARLHVNSELLEADRAKSAAQSGGVLRFFGWK